MSCAKKIQEYIPLQTVMGKQWGKCPFCNEKTLLTDSNEFTCYTCGRSGDENDFINSYLKVYKKPEVLLTTLSEEVFRLNREITDIFKKDIGKASNYISKRDIPESLIKTFEMGYIENGFDILKQIQGRYSKEAIMNSGFVNIKGNPLFYKRLMIPIKDAFGNIIGFGGRIIDDSDFAKYVNSAETQTFHKRENLFNLDKAKEHLSDGVILCEGYMDVAALYNAGIKNVVAGLGTALTINQLELLRAYTDKLYLCYDNDEAGNSATMRNIERAKEVDFDIYFIDTSSTGCKDPDEIIKKYGPDKFRKLIKNSIPARDFIISQLEKNGKIEELLEFFLKEQ